MARADSRPAALAGILRAARYGCRSATTLELITTTPKALLVETLTLHVVPMMESLGFRWIASAPKFRRERGPVIDEVSFSRSRWNHGDFCSFWTAWAVRSKVFRSWYSEVWAKAPTDDYLVITNDWLLKGWPRSANGFTVRNELGADATEMMVLIDAFTKIGVPFLEEHSTPESGAEFWLERKIRMDRPIDLLVMSGQEARAWNVLQDLVREAKAFNGPATRQYLAYLSASTSKYFPDNEL